MQRGNMVTRVILVALLLTGISVRLINYFSNSGLWLDEALLALNILEKSYSQLVYPLESNQVAPVLFLWIEKLSCSLFGPGELSFRLFPLICSIMSLPLFYMVARDILKDEKPVMIALFIFALAPLQIRYSAEIKQYMTDLFVFLLLIWLFQRYLRNHQVKSLLLLCISGIISVFLSNISVLILFTIGIYWIIREWYAKHFHYSTFIVLAIWISSFLLYYYFFIFNHSTKGFMLNFWHENFMPLNPFLPEFWNFFYNKAFKVFLEFLVYNQSGFSSLHNMVLSWIFLVIYIVSLCLLLIRRNLTIFYFLFFPLVFHLLLSGFGIYPFDTRLALYLSPLVIIAFSYGLYKISELSLYLFRAEEPGVIGIILILLVFPSKLQQNFPIEIDGVRNSIQFINENYSKGQPVYVNYYTVAPFEYYNKTGRVIFGDMVLRGSGQGSQADWNEDLQKLQDLRGEVWLLFSHLYMKNEANHKNMLQTLEKRGHVKLSRHSKISAAYLIELSD